MHIKELYEVEFKSDERAIIRLADANHPIFKAHFPEQPVMPGFINFEIVADVFDMEVTTIKKAKFLGLVEPNQTLVYEKKANKFRVFCQEKEVANFTL